MDALDRVIINSLQGGFPLSERPYADAAARLGTSEDELIRRIDALLESGMLTRFGPMYNAERLGGALTLAAMQVPPADFERVAIRVNAHPEVAHNYARDHAFNMWFVLATERPEQIDAVIAEIERETGLQVYNMPKLEEFFVGLRFEA
jgi:DNA-binding Lrp family transcriptional regulator